MKFKELKKHQTFGGETVFCEHDSQETKTPMRFSYFKPNCASVKKIVLWLSGLTCTDENFMAKAGVQKLLKDSSTVVVCPDTSPRGLELPEEHEAYDFGSGAGFYLDALTPGYKDHYRMESYLLKELIPLLKTTFGVSDFSISGHSMGGHGALILALKNPEIFSGVSAFSPIVNPMKAPWGEKAFTGYLGDDRSVWKNHDACELVAAGHKFAGPILIDQGLQDDFLEKQLLTKNFENICKEFSQELKVNYQEGYDHSYYFIASFLESHLEHLGAIGKS